MPPKITEEQIATRVAAQKLLLVLRQVASLIWPAHSTRLLLPGDEDSLSDRLKVFKV